MSVGRPTLTTLAFLYAVLGLLLVWSTPAFAIEEHVFSASFGSEGSGNGQFKELSGVAVNDSTGQVYVVDKGNNRVERFTAAGAYESQFNGAAGPSGSFSSPTGIAVDNSSSLTDLSAGDVYVIDAGHRVIDKFSSAGVYEGTLTEAASGTPFEELYGVAVDPSGNVWVYESNGYIDEFDDIGSLVGRFNTERSTAPGLAVDATGHVYALLKYLAAVEYNSTTGSELYESNENLNASAIAVDPATGNLFVDRTNPETGTSEIGVFTPFKEKAPVPIETFGVGGSPESPGVAVNSTNDTVYAVELGASDVEIFTVVVLPDVTTGEATKLESTEGTATLGGTVVPSGQSVTSCEFEYGLDTSYGTSVPCEQTSSDIGVGDGQVRVTATVSNLLPGTLYHYRLIADNVNSGDPRITARPGVDKTFVAPTHPKVEGESTVVVTADSATLSAQVLPGGLDTKYRFEYGTSNAYGSSLPLTEADAGSTLTATSVRLDLQDLQPRTEYHFRVVATNNFGTQDGSDDTFTTQVAGGALVLPDGRAWEIVSPLEKRGARILPLIEGVVEAADDGAAFTYLTVEPIVANPQGNSNDSQVLATRGPDGWVTEDLATQHEDDEGVGLGSGPEYRAFSPDLMSAAVWVPNGGSAPAPNVPGGVGHVYLRDNRSGTFSVLAEKQESSEEVATVVSNWYEEQVNRADKIPAGPYRAFMSGERLTGYDNRDAKSGQPDQEVFLENASTKHVVCVSCNPTGVRPEGVLDQSQYGEDLLVDPPEQWKGLWLAGSIPGQTSLGAGRFALHGRSFLDHATGRLFFDSPDGLVPQATNGLENVYEYEPAGVGSCTSGSLGFSPSSEGCVTLISSGSSLNESAFLDASADGSDVFFMTTAKLVPHDADRVFDVYDAHVCSGASPCFPQPPVSSPACVTADSCRAAPTPQPTIFAASGSATFSGAGNVSESASERRDKSKSLIPVKRLSTELKLCRQKWKRHKKERLACETHTRRAHRSAMMLSRVRKEGK